MQSESSLLEGLSHNVVTAEIRNGTQVSEWRWEEIANLHTQGQPEEMINTLNDSQQELLEQSSLLLTLVNTREGEYSNRAINTGIKQKPNKNDLKSINNMITALTEREKATPMDNPFTYIWLAKCILS